jgi:transaldolase/glucose-6-phosphate isomerase
MPLDVTARRGRLQNSLRLTPGPLADALAARAQDAERALGGLYRREPAVWSDDANVRTAIANRLGWLSSPETMRAAIPRLRDFAASIRADGFSDVVLLGMGGSSLAPEVLRAVLGVAPGWPRFHMLDSTDPAAVRSAATSPPTTLYILASKSGTTIEPNALAAHFARRLQQAGAASWGDHFVAITDQGTELEARARRERFRELFLNPSDIGGRYSALSFFGLVPAALMGQDVESLVEWGLAMLAAAEPGFGDAAANPAVGLGLAIGSGAHAGRDKMTLLLPPALEPFGLWVEQLIAESTGKQGVGIVPIAGEPEGEALVYGADRLFVRVHTSAAGSARSRELAPGVDIDWSEPEALGAEFVRWEIATAIAGALLHINPFDEPNVQQAKDATRALLRRYRTDGRLPPSSADATIDGISLQLSAAAKRYLDGGRPERFLSLVRQGDYVALLAYLAPNEALTPAFRDLRRDIRDRTHAATMFGYGPRYLHSTGQLHKGGPNTGVFVLVTAAPIEDVEIPGEGFSFGTLELAQALGDFQSLDAAGRRVIHVHLPSAEVERIRVMSGFLLSGIEERARR